MELLPDLAVWTPADWSAASGLATLLVAVAATVIAWRSLKQARDLREEEAAPYIVVDVVTSEDSNWIFDLVIENTGKTVARDVQVTFDPPVQTTFDGDDYALGNWSPLCDGIRTMVPGCRLTTMFDSAPQRVEADLPRQYEVTVAYKNAGWREQEPIFYTVDLEPIYGAMFTDRKGLNHLVEEVTKLRKAVEPIATKRLTVEVLDGEAENVKRAERRKQFRRDVRAFEERRGLPQSDPDAPGTGGPGTTEET